MTAATRTARSWNGWPLVGLATLALLAMIAILAAVHGTNEAGLRVVIRATARTSFALFITAFVASSLRRAWRSDATAWLLRNRRQIGVSFAVSHLLHLLAIFALYDWSLGRFFGEIGAPAIVVGGIGYLFVAALAATSFDTTAAWLGQRRWKRLHTAGMYWLWGVFTISYVPRALMESAAYAPLALASLAALALRIRYRRRRAPLVDESRPADYAPA